MFLMGRVMCWDRINEMMSMTASVTSRMSTSVWVEWRTTPAVAGSWQDTKMSAATLPSLSRTQLPTV